jgi:hypothetical protein
MAAHSKPGKPRKPDYGGMFFFVLTCLIIISAVLYVLVRTN